jgi:chromosome segregation ATPase
MSHDVAKPARDGGQSVRNLVLKTLLYGAAGGSNILTWVLDPQWGMAGSILLVGGTGLIAWILSQWKKASDARILIQQQESKARRDNELEESKAKIEAARLKANAEIDNLRDWERAYAGSSKQKLDTLMEQVAQQNDSLVKARLSLHDLRNQAHVDDMRRVEEINMLREQLANASQEIHSLRDDKKELVRKVDVMTSQMVANTLVVNRVGAAVAEVSEQVQANKEALGAVKDSTTPPPCP